MIKEFFKKLDTKAGLLQRFAFRNDRMAAFCHGSIPQSLRTSYKKAAFTLAEVLITLAIIGVVAALTIPNLIKSYQKKVTVEKLKSTYAILQQSIRLSEVDNGPISSWEILVYDGDVFFEKYLRKYLKIQNDEITPKTFSMSCDYTYLNGTHPSGDNLLNRERVHFYTLSNGVTLFVLMNSLRNAPWQIGSGQYSRTLKRYATIYIDINGPKKPNQWGKDTFTFRISAEKRLTFEGMYSTLDLVLPTEPNQNRNYIKNNNCNKNSIGQWCGLLIYLDGWKISKDYPW